jgi:hypothetical protein
MHLLIGRPGAVCEWFAIRASDNKQIPLTKIGEGTIGEGGEFSLLPLF